MKRKMKKLTAFTASVAVLAGSFLPVKNPDLNIISAEEENETDSGYEVRLDSYSYESILLDGKYYAYNTASLIRKIGDGGTFIVPSRCVPDEEARYGYYAEDEEQQSRIFVLDRGSVDSGRCENIIVSDGIMEIRQNAFIEKSIRSVTIADSVIVLGEQPFDEETVIRGHMGSLAENYANKHGHIFEYLGDVDNSGEINATDIVNLINDLNGNKPLDENASARADENYDAKLNIADLIMLKSEIIDPRASGLGASFNGAKAAPDLKHIEKISKADADGYLKFASDSASAVLIDTVDENGEKNTVYSPLSYYMALSMAAECASGNTRDEFISALGAEDIDDLRTENNSLFRSLYFDDYTAYCKIANSLWLNNKWTFRQDTLDTIADKYYGVSFERDFKDKSVPGEISAWINKNTSGKFSPDIKIVQPEVEIMKILNTVTFKDAWQSKFGTAKKDTFVTDEGKEVECDFLGYTRLYKDIGFADKYMRCSELMKNGFSMNFILPDEGVTVSELISDSKTMEEIYSDSVKHEKRKTIFSVPKFNVASKYALVKASEALGINDAFSDVKGDFTSVIDYGENGIPSAYLSEIIHEATVAIDEDGCEAAAYTIISMAAGSAAPPEEEPVYFELNRPFFYYISDSNGTPLFAGVINDPLMK